MKGKGIIEYSDIRNLSSAQKGVITKKWNEWSFAVNRPESFHIVRVGKERQKVLHDLGFKITKRGVAYIPLYEYQSAKIKKDGIVYQSGNLTEKTFFTSAQTFHRKAEELLKKPIQHNQTYTARIGDSGAFHRAAFRKYSDLVAYLSTMKFNDKKPRHDMYQLISLVTIDGKRMTEKQVKKAKQDRKNAAKKERAVKTRNR